MIQKLIKLFLICFLTMFPLPDDICYINCKYIFSSKCVEAREVNNLKDILPQAHNNFSVCVHKCMID